MAERSQGEGGKRARPGRPHWEGSFSIHSRCTRAAACEALDPERLESSPGEEGTQEREETPVIFKTPASVTQGDLAKSAYISALRTVGILGLFVNLIDIFAPEPRAKS